MYVNMFYGIISEIKCSNQIKSNSNTDKAYEYPIKSTQLIPSFEKKMPPTRIQSPNVTWNVVCGYKIFSHILQCCPVSHDDLCLLLFVVGDQNKSRRKPFGSPMFDIVNSPDNR